MAAEMNPIEGMLPAFMRGAAAPTMDPLWDSLHSLPVGIHAAAVTGLIAGLVLWVFGRRLIHPAFGVLGLSLGGAMGFLSAPTLGVPDIEGVDGSTVGLIAGAVVGLLVAVLMFRVILAVLASACVGVGAVLGAALYLELGPTFSPHDSPVQAHVQPTQAHKPLPRETSESVTRSVRDGSDDNESAEGDTNRDRVERFVRTVAMESVAAWQEVPVAHRAVIVLSGMIGLALGFVGGLFMPRWSASLVTGLFGAAVWMSCAAWLMHAAGWATPGVREFPALMWLIGWVSLGFIGTAAQLIGVAKRRKPAATNA